MIRLLPITAARSQPLRRARPAGRPAGLTAALAASTVTAAAIALAAAVLPAQAATLPARTGGHPAAAISHHPARGGQHPARSRMRAACGQARPGYARCLALYQPEVTVNAAIAAGAGGLASQPQGWGPRAPRTWPPTWLSTASISGCRPAPPQPGACG